MQKYFDTDFETTYEAHVNHLRSEFSKLLENHGLDSMVIYSGETSLYFEDDAHYPFRCNPHYVYWIPEITHQQSYLIIKKDQKPTLYFYAPQDFWHKHDPLPQSYWTKHYDIAPYGEFKEMEKVLSQGAFKQSAFVGAQVEKHRPFEFKVYNDSELRDDVHILRTIKTNFEVQCIAHANLKAARAHVLARDMFWTGKHSEYEVNNAYINQLRDTEAELPYTGIVAFNENAAVLHYTRYEKERRQLQDLKTFLIDAGANFGGRASDITRTYAFDRQSEFAEMIADFDKRQLHLVGETKLGQTYAQTHEQTHYQVAEWLVKFNFVTADTSVNQLVDEGITSSFFPHGLGHLLGVQVHDVGGGLKEKRARAKDLVKDEANPRDKYLRYKYKIEKGHVVTVEPGVYFIPMLLDKLKKDGKGKCLNWDRVEKMLPYGGIRIEDDIYLDEKGAIQNLTREAFQRV